MIERSSAGFSACATVVRAGTSGETPPRPWSDGNNPDHYGAADAWFTAHRLGADADEGEADARHCARMVDVGASYPVLWSEPDEGPVSGTLTVDGDAVRLDGGRQGQVVRRSIAYRDLAGVRVGRARGDLLAGRPAIVVERHRAPALLVRPLGAGLLSELADLLARLCETRDRVEQVAVVLPLRPGGLGAARELVAEGPPFDPAEAEIERHAVFLTEREAIFVFSGSDACDHVRSFMDDMAVWHAADRWAACLDGPPRLAEATFSFSADD